jgi:hypothetical protein
MYISGKYKLLYDAVFLRHSSIIAIEEKEDEVRRYNDDDVYLEYYNGNEFHINYSVYISYVKHMV